eukprot:2218995-Prymnesium_polylepis.1
MSPGAVSGRYARPFLSEPKAPLCSKTNYSRTEAPRPVVVLLSNVMLQEHEPGGVEMRSPSRRQQEEEEEEGAGS